MQREYRKAAVAVCLVMSAMIAGTASFGFFMDPVTEDLGFGRGAFSLYFSIVTVVGACTLPVYGRVIARVGARRVVIAGGAWTGAAIASFSLCSSLPAFYLVAALVGLGFFGCSYIAAPVIVDAWFVEKNGAVMGAAAACGGLIGVALGFAFPAVISALGWRMGYVCMGVLVLLLTAPAGVFLLHSTPAEVGLAPYGAVDGDERAQTAGADVAGAGMTRAEAQRTPAFWMLVGAFLVFAAAVAVTQHLAAYFVSIGTSSVFAGAMVSVISAGIVITSALVGAVTDRIGLLKTVVVCALLYAASFLLLPLSGASLLPVCVALFFMALGNAFNTIIAPVVTSTVFGTREYAAIWGFVSMACVLGQALGTPLWGLSFDLTGGYQAGMFVAAVANVVGMLLIAGVLKRAHAHVGGELESVHEQAEAR